MNFIFRCMPAKQIGLLLLILTGWATLGGAGEPPQGVAPSERWSGDLPVARLELLPEGQRLTRNGYIGDEATFAAVWQAMKPGETLPPVDFAHNLVVFSRNVDFYNRIDILRVALSPLQREGGLCP